MSEKKYRLKHGVGKHYLPPGKQGDIGVLMKPGTRVSIEEIPVAAKDKFELIGTGKVEEVKTITINNLEAVDEAGDGKWVVLHKKTGKPIHEGFLTKSEAEELLGEPIVEKKKKPTRSTTTKKGKDKDA